MAYRDINPDRKPKRWVAYVGLAVLAVAAVAVSLYALSL